MTQVRRIRTMYPPLLGLLFFVDTSLRVELQERRRSWQRTLKMNVLGYTSPALSTQKPDKYSACTYVVQVQESNSTRPCTQKYIYEIVYTRTMHGKPGGGNSRRPTSSGNGSLYEHLYLERLGWEGQRCRHYLTGHPKPIPRTYDVSHITIWLSTSRLTWLCVLLVARTQPTNFGHHRRQSA